MPVHPRGRIIPYYATIDRDERIPFWRALGAAVHEHDCKFIMQLSHGGRQRDIPDLLYPKGQSSTDKSDPLHGFECDRMTIADIKEVVAAFAEGARRAREAGLDGVELHGANGYLITQFLSSAINDRTDEYGGSLENRARFVLDIVKAIRARVGRDFHLQMKISATEHNNALLRPEARGRRATPCRSRRRSASGWSRPAWTPFTCPPAARSRIRATRPDRTCDVDLLSHTYEQLASSGTNTFRNLLLFHNDISGELFRKQWRDAGVPKDEIEGLTLPDAHIIKQAVAVPVICTGGFQTASVIRKAITDGHCDAVSSARPLVANNDLVKQFAAGRDQRRAAVHLLQQVPPARRRASARLL